MERVSPLGIASTQTWHRSHRRHRWMPRYAKQVSSTARIMSKLKAADPTLGRSQNPTPCLVPQKKAGWWICIPKNMVIMGFDPSSMSWWPISGSFDVLLLARDIIGKCGSQDSQALSQRGNLELRPESTVLPAARQQWLKVLVRHCRTHSTWSPGPTSGQSVVLNLPRISTMWQPQRLGSWQQNFWCQRT